jgi:hypothetical protein
MNQSVEPLLEKYVRPNGEIMWPVSEDFQSIDGLDDAYESFHNWPLFYALGGDKKLLDLSIKEYNAITRQFARYDSGHGHPMVVKEYEQGYDWFHQGEGYQFFYNLGLADPTNAVNIERARRYAGFYLNEDPQAPNYDEKLKLVRSTHNGSMGPAFHNYDDTDWGWADWKQYYGLPFQGVPGCTRIEDVKDPVIARRMGELLKQRFPRGDVPVNLAITSMVTNAYLYSGEQKYKAWVKEYLEAWMQRAAENNGIIPDNVGLSGKVGEYIDGKWYGGNYGWTWPHGWLAIGDAVTAAAENAVLLYGDMGYLDLPRSQMDVLISHGIPFEGTLYVPGKYGDPGYYEYTYSNMLTADMRLGAPDQINTILWKDGWFEFLPFHPSRLAHLWSLSLNPADMERIVKVRNYHNHDFEKVVDTHEKHQGGHDAAWAAYLSGEFPAYPEEILKYNLLQVERRLAFMQEDTQDPLTYGDYYLQVRNPITLEGLVQLTLGAPLPLYNGGLLFAPLRYFDRAAQRPGLPPDVGALVEKVTADKIVLTLVNLSAEHTRQLTLQAGAYGEHRFKAVRTIHAGDSAPEGAPQVVNGRSFEIDMPAGTQITLEIGLHRFAYDPSYTPKP